MRHLAIIQERFEAAPFNPIAPVPIPPSAAKGRRAKSALGLQPGSVVPGLSRTLAALYPVVRRMVGAESFGAAAQRFVTLAPPRSSSLLAYAERFPSFLRRLGDGASFEYLADIAELEMARARAYHAAGAAPVGARTLSSLSTERFAASRVILHPSVSLIASRFPIVTIWQANRSDNGDGMIDRWGAEAALVARPFRDVEVWRLPAGGHAFVAALLKGATIAEAVEAGLGEAPAFEPGSNLAVLAESKVVIGFGQGVGKRRGRVLPPDRHRYHQRDRAMAFHGGRSHL